MDVGRRLDRLTEDEAEGSRFSGAERVGGRESEVDFQQIGRDEGAIGRRAGAHVEVVDAVEFGVDEVAPLSDDVRDGDLVRHREEQVNVGPLVLFTSSGRAGHRGADDPRIASCALKQPGSDLFARFDGEPEDPR
jgi:hypothetical protein